MIIVCMCACHSALCLPRMWVCAPATIFLHAGLWLWDRMSFVPVATSAGAHVAYLLLLRSFPFFLLLSPEGVASMALMLAANGMWAYHFWCASLHVGI